MCLLSDYSKDMYDRYLKCKAKMTLLCNSRHDKIRDNIKYYEIFSTKINEMQKKNEKETVRKETKQKKAKRKEETVKKRNEMKSTEAHR